MELQRIEKGLKGEVAVPPDKSLSHRAVMFSALASGESRVKNFLRAEDPLSTMEAFRQLGAEIEDRGEEVLIRGKGLHGLREAADLINCGNSGTTIRLISGILSGNPFFSVLTGDGSLRQRPMARVITPLKEMGAEIWGRDGDRLPPLAIKGRPLKPIDYTLPMASAQVKSCLILAGLYAEGVTVLTEPQGSRDHSERMLRSMGADLEVEGLKVKVKGQGTKELSPIDCTVPADFSSAAFFLVAGLLVRGSEVVMRGVGINPTRTGLLEVIRQMGASVAVENVREVSGEPVADLICRSADRLKAVSLGKDIMPSLIDEFPILCIVATQAEGVTEIRGAEELRVKESDRISAMSAELRKMGVELEEYPDGIAIRGGSALKGGNLESHADHRIAMSLAVASLIAEGPTTISNASCVDISFPGFFKSLYDLGRTA